LNLELEIYILINLVSAEMGDLKVVIPESVLKKRKREEEWALAKKQELEATKKKNAENRKLIFNRAKLYTKEYEEQVYISYLYFYSVHAGVFVLMVP
jgi:hypothetical protein